MGGLSDMKENKNNIWSKLQSDHQKPPDSKTRVRFLLDEIALLQNKDHVEKKPAFLKAEAALNYDTPRGQAPSVSEDHQQVSTSKISTYEDLLKNTEEKLEVVLIDRPAFYERAEKELRAGKIDRWELAKLMELEKSKLQKHRNHVEDLQEILSSTFSSANAQGVHTHAQELVNKIRQVLDERESFHLKFEVQVELGHIFRLLKLLELQKSKHDASRKELEKVLESLRVAVNDEKNMVQDLEQTSKDSNFEEVNELLLQYSSSGTRHEHDQDRNSLNSEETPPDYSRYKKEAKLELLKIIAEKEESWRARELVVDELERRLSLSELENRRLSDVISDRNSDCRCGGTRRSDGLSGWTGGSGLPEGYTSVYWSPIFQERKNNENNGTSPDLEIRKLKEEISRLRRKEKENHFMVTQRAEVPMEEKTIPVDSTSTDDDLLKLFKVLGTPDVLNSGNDHHQQDDGVLPKNIVKNFLMLLQLHEDESRKRQIPDVCMELCKQLNEFREFKTGKSGRDDDPLSETQAEVLHAELRRLKTEIAHVVEEHVQELESKRKALTYAQELNLQLASDMSTTENALAELRAEYNGMKASFEEQLRIARLQAEDMIQSLRRELDAVALSSTADDFRRKMEACQRETDAMALEKQELLLRIQSLAEEAVKHSSNSCRLHQCLEEARLASLEMEAKLASLVEGSKESEQLNSEVTSLRDELRETQEELKRIEQDRNDLQAKLLDTEYELEQREAALERLTLHLAATIKCQSVNQTKGVESLRSKHFKMLRAKRSIYQVEEKMESMVLEWSQAKMDMEEIRSFVQELHS